MSDDHNRLETDNADGGLLRGNKEPPCGYKPEASQLDSLPVADLV